MPAGILLSRLGFLALFDVQREQFLGSTPRLQPVATPVRPPITLKVTGTEPDELSTSGGVPALVHSRSPPATSAAVRAVTALRHGIRVARWKLASAVKAMQPSATRYNTQPTYATVIGDSLTRSDAEEHLSLGCIVRVQVIDGHTLREERKVKP